MGVLGDRHGFTPTLARAALRLPDHRRVFAVGRNGQPRLAEDSLQCGRIVDEHVAGRRPHEDFDSARVRAANAADFLEVGVGRAEIETVVDVTGCSRDPAFLGERGAIGRRRRRVRHFEKARDSAADRRERLGRERRLVSKARLAAMHLVVDDPRQQVLARKIDDLRARRNGTRTHALDPVAANQHIGLDGSSFVDECGVHEQQRAHVPLRDGLRNRSVAASSSAVMPGS
jgi:hypothetical protein